MFAIFVGSFKKKQVDQEIFCGSINISVLHITYYIFFFMLLYPQKYSVLLIMNMTLSSLQKLFPNGYDIG